MAPKLTEVLSAVSPLVLWLVGYPLTVLFLALQAFHQWHKCAREAREYMIALLAASQREEDRAQAQCLQQWIVDDTNLQIAGPVAWYGAYLKAFGLWLGSFLLRCLRCILKWLEKHCCAACACARAILHCRKKALLVDEERPDPSSTAEPIVHVQPGQLSTMTIQGGSRRQNQPGSEESGKSDKQA